jgi:hypothetical protein
MSAQLFFLPLLFALSLCAMLPSEAIAGVPPSITAQPASATLAKGAALSLSITAVGQPDPIYQWLRNGKLINGATGPSYDLAALVPGDSASYTCQLRNIAGSLLSAAAVVTVVDGDDKEVPVILGSTATLTAPTLATTPSFHWQKDGADIAVDARISGQNGRVLTIKNLTLSDIGGYTCSTATAAGSLPGGVQYLVPVTDRPAVVTPTWSQISVADRVAWDIEADNYPTKFSITGLPLGLGFNATTGEIKGVARLAGTFPIKIIASNALGNSAPVIAPLTVLPFPLVTGGTMSGLVSAEATMNHSLGGRADFTVLPSGFWSGKVKLASTVYPFAGAFEFDPVAIAYISVAKVARIGKPPLTLILSINGADTLSGTLYDGLPESAPVYVSLDAIARRYATQPPTKLWAGYYTYGSDSFGTFLLGANGVGTGVLYLSDGSAVSFSGDLNAYGTVVIFAPLYGNTGVVSGTLGIDVSSWYGSVAATPITANLHWYKAPQTKFTRSFMEGFDNSPALSGSGWAPGAIAAIAKAKYGTLNFGGSGTRLTVSAAGKGYFEKAYSEFNPLAWRSFSVNPTTGLISATATPRDYPDPDNFPTRFVTRTISARGVLVFNPGYGYIGQGFARLADLPDASIPTTLTNSPIRSYTMSYTSTINIY